MRLVVFLGCVVLAATGCQGGKFGRYSAIAGTPCPPGDPAANGAGGPAGQYAQYPQSNCQHHQPDCTHKCAPACKEKPPVREVRAPVEAAPEARATAAAIAPDILLIPKTVLVPYAPHVPTGPVRLAGVSPAQFCPPEDRASAPPPVAAAPDPRVTDALDQCLQQMKLLNQRIGDLESRAARSAPVPQSCPPLRGAPCPAPGVISPGIAFPPGLLPQPRPWPPGSVPMVPPPTATSGSE